MSTIMTIWFFQISLQGKINYLIIHEKKYFKNTPPQKKPKNKTKNKTKTHKPKQTNKPEFMKTWKN